MNVGLNMAITRRGISGTARLVQHIQRALGSSPGIELIAVHPPERRRGRMRRAVSSAHWDLWGASRAARDLDAFISPCNIGRAPRCVPHLLWMLDTMVLDHPEWYDPGFVAYARLLFGSSARGSTRVLTISRHSAGRIRERWPSAAPVEVIRLPAEVHASSPRRMPRGRLRVLIVGATEVHKNHLAAIETLQIAREASGLDLGLVVVGPAGRAEQPVREAGLRADPDGGWFERRLDVSEAELRALYEDAWLLIQPAFDEGFGLPLLEAAGHGLPVVHSGRGAMNEVVSSGSVESTEAPDLAAGLLELLDETSYRQRSAAVLEDARAHGPGQFRQELVTALENVSAGAR